MQQQNNQQFQSSTNMPAQQSHGAHELFDAHETISTLIGTIEHYKMYEPSLQSQQLKNIFNRQFAYLTQLYNTMVDTYQTGQRPPQPTTTYNMEISNDVTYGMSQTEPKQPAMSPQQLKDEDYAGFMMGHLKACATACTTAALESTNPVMRRVLQDSVPNFCEMAYEIFLYLNDNGSYQVPQFDQQTHNAMINMYTRMNPQQPQH